MTTLYKNWAENMAYRVRHRYISRHMVRAASGVVCLLLGFVFWNMQAPDYIEAGVTAEFLSQQVEGTYSQVVPPSAETFWEL